MATKVNKVLLAGAMIDQGGSFAAALGQALLRADHHNECRIRSAFPDFCEEYSKRARELFLRDPICAGSRYQVVRRGDYYSVLDTLSGDLVVHDKTMPVCEAVALAGNGKSDGTTEADEIGRNLRKE